MVTFAANPNCLPQPLQMAVLNVFSLMAAFGLVVFIYRAAFSCLLMPLPTKTSYNQSVTT